MRKHFLFISIAFIITFVEIQNTRCDEGMYPISEIHKLHLKQKGFRISAKELYNPSGVSFIDAIVNIGGCTGSFVSPDGLILTNHHCAFPAVQAASSKENDYITNGFLAQTRSKEIPARGNTVRIIDSYRDVSAEALKGVDDKMNFTDRTKTIGKNIRKIIIDAEEQNPGKRAEVAEMFAGKTYLLFMYTFLKDVRLVYVPPRSIGEFGGENDNWIWPRHTGDFSFMRAYVGPDGSPAEYSPNNIPFHPKKFLKIAPDGVNENDFVFILGYPGRTYRHRTSHYLAFEQEVRMPYVVQWYQWQMNLLEKMSRDNRSVAIKHASRIKSLANTEKNYRGKLIGMKRLNIVARKKEEEMLMQKFIDSDASRKERFGNLLSEIGNVYHDMRKNIEKELILEYLRSSTLLNAAYTIFEAVHERTKNDIDREGAYTDRNFNRTKENVRSALKNYHEPTDGLILKEMLLRAARLPDDQKILAVDELIENNNIESSIDRFIDKSYTASKLKDEKFVLDAFNKSTVEIDTLHDPFINFVKMIYPAYQNLKEIRARREGALSKLSAGFIDVKQDYQKTNFIPDANSTLRLTFGHIRGYQPADATYYRPFTTLTGIIEKITGQEPYEAPQKLIDLYKTKDYGKFKSTALNDLSVAMLYDLDTTGGNSGSPVMNAKGEVVGINFDRTFEATINDYAWNENYSRSIAVDIRYVLWVTQKIGGAEFLLKEMSVD